MYTTREVSQPAPITAAGMGNRVPAISIEVRYGVRFSVKLAWARWADSPGKTELESVDQFFRMDLPPRPGGVLTAVQLVRSGVLLRLLGCRVRVGVPDALDRCRESASLLRLARLVLTVGAGVMIIAVPRDGPRAMERSLSVEIIYVHWPSWP